MSISWVGRIQKEMSLEVLNVFIENEAGGKDLSITYNDLYIVDHGA